MQLFTCLTCLMRVVSSFQHILLYKLHKDDKSSQIQHPKRTGDHAALQDSYALAKVMLVPAS